MNWQDKRVKIMAVFLVVLTAVIGFRIVNNLISAKNRAASVAQGKAIAVPVAKATRGTISPILKFSGSLEPIWQADIAPKIQGRIEKILVEEGQKVEAGTALAILDRGELYAAATAAEGSVFDARAALEQAETTLARNEALFAQGAVSQSALDSARFTRDMAVGKLKAATGNYENAASRMEGTNIVTPQAGYVVKRYHQEGYFAAAGSLLFNVADISTLVAKINIPEGQVAMLAEGATAKIEIPSLSGVEVQGVLTKIAKVADMPARTFAAEVSINNEEGRLRGGIYGNVIIRTSPKANALIIPQSAIVMREDQRTVLVVDANNIAQRKVIATGYIGDGIAEVLGGLDENELIITGGQNKVREGSTVKLDEGGITQ